MNKTITYIRKELKTYYDDREVNQFVFIIFDHLMNFSKIDVHTKNDTTLTENIVQKTKKIVSELKKYRPIQYVLGQTEFYDLKFDVTPDVLIPRPETEELVKWIHDDHHNQKQKIKSILDIGSGSGCIAIRLAKWFPHAQVDAMDISKTAIEVAKHNAEHNQTSISFCCDDILMPSNKIWTNKKYSVIVSNPPYVRETEKSLMNKNVVDFEPHNALFVPDNDPLIFYRAIGLFAMQHLDEHGKLYVEINENFGNETVELFKNMNLKDIVLRKDINDKNRMIRCNL